GDEHGGAQQSRSQPSVSGKPACGAMGQSGGGRRARVLSVLGGGGVHHGNRHSHRRRLDGEVAMQPMRFTVLTLLAGALLACLPAQLLAQAQPAAPPRARAGESTREFLGLGPAPDAEAAERGAPVYAANCAFCHGPLARGAEGPSLIYSELVLKDVHGAVVADFLKAGRPEKGMPSFATLSDEQRKDVAEFLHQQIEDVANRGAYQVKNIVLGDPKKGASYVAAHCLSCHSLTGDLKGLPAKWRPIDLQRYWIMPPRTGAGRAITAT